MESRSSEDGGSSIEGESVSMDTDEAVTTSHALAKGRPYPAHVAQILESLYKNGMTGWGRRHSANLEQAVKSTGLDLSQVKVIM